MAALASGPLVVEGPTLRPVVPCAAVEEDSAQAPEPDAAVAPHRKPLPPSWFADAAGGRQAMYMVAPMVGQCDLPFRHLARRYGATVVFSEMLLADRFAAEEGYRTQAFGTGVRDDDHPLVCQFAANNPDAFVAAALEAQRLGCDAVDLNLGCPQRRAREERYGAYLTDPPDWALCASIIAAAASHPSLTIPVTVKIRLQPAPGDTVRFARLLASAGASLVTVHGRQRGREDRRRDGSADLQAVAEVVATLAPLGCPVASNGNVRCAGDVVANLASTGACGIMVAEEILRDPAVFARARASVRANRAVPATLDDLAGNGGGDGGGGGEGGEGEGGACAAAGVPSVRQLVDEYAALIEALDGAGGAGGGGRAASDIVVAGPRLCMEDGSRPGKNGTMIRRRVGGGGGGGDDSGDVEFERLSVWWANAEVLKGHLRHLLGDRGQLVSRNTFKKAPTSAAVLLCYRRRLAARAQTPQSQDPAVESAEL